MDWRQYDPAIARFITIDAMAELPEQIDLTPYNFAWNNPIMYSDPSGLCPECPDVADHKPGDTYEINGETYVVDQDGQWSRQGGELEEVIINSTSNNDSAENSTEEEQGTIGLKSVSRYDFSKDVIPGKQAEDIDFILNGHEPGMNTMLHRLVAIIDRDLSADAESQEMVEILTLTTPIKISRTVNVTKSQSTVWKKLQNAKKGRKTSGKGKKKKYYEWDHTHNDIEVYNSRGQHLGSMNPQTGEMYKPAVTGRTIDL